MSTRSCLALLEQRPANRMGFAGIYHHFDGYPTGLGLTLVAALSNPAIGFPAVTRAITDHLGGWSTFPDVCYCHTKGEDAGDRLMTEDTADPLFIEWAYALTESGFVILKGMSIAEPSPSAYMGGGAFVALTAVDIARPPAGGWKHWFLRIERLVYDDDSVIPYAFEAQPAARVVVWTGEAFEPAVLGRPLSLDLAGLGLAGAAS